MITSLFIVTMCASVHDACVGQNLCATPCPRKPEDTFLVPFLSPHPRLAQHAPLSTEPSHPNCAKSLLNLSPQSAISRSGCYNGVPKAVVGTPADSLKVPSYRVLSF